MAIRKKKILSPWIVESIIHQGLQRDLIVLTMRLLSEIKSCRHYTLNIRMLGKLAVGKCIASGFLRGTKFTSAPFRVYSCMDCVFSHRGSVFK